MGISGTSASTGFPETARKARSGPLPGISLPVVSAEISAAPVAGRQDLVTAKSGTGKLASLTTLPAKDAAVVVPASTSASPPHQADLERLLAAFVDLPDVQRVVNGFARRFPGSETTSLYRQLARALDVQPRAEFGNIPPGPTLALRLIQQIDSPGSNIFQGKDSTSCTSASLQSILARSNPAKYVSLACDLLSTGESVLPGLVNSHVIKLSANDFKKPSRGRGPVSTAIQSAFDRYMNIKPGKGASPVSFNSLYRSVTGERVVNVVPDEAVLNDLFNSSNRERYKNVPVLMKPEVAGEMGHSLVICNVDRHSVYLDDPSTNEMIRMPLEEFHSKCACLVMLPSKTSTKQKFIDNVITSEFGLFRMKSARTSRA